ncbi:hypothetical protein BDV93DRAFT_322052 [Ceratobasidium sp. AG-I]|nr:hypothetical protein BDV93DRAFT_322052 [Ceratobasidium sp. AG-I]
MGTSLSTILLTSLPLLYTLRKLILHLLRCAIRISKDWFGLSMVIAPGVQCDYSEASFMVRAVGSYVFSLDVVVLCDCML